MVSIDTIKGVCQEKGHKYADDVCIDILNHLGEFNTDRRVAMSKLRNFRFANNDIHLYDRMFSLLKENNYNINFEIIDFLFVFRKDQVQALQMYSKSPYINKIQLKGNECEIDSNMGEFSFKMASSKHYELLNYYFMCNVLLSKIANGQGLCHFHTKTLTQMHPYLYSTTSLVSSMYDNVSYYHTYCVDKDTDEVIDLCYDMIMDREQYYKLFKCQEVFQVEGSKLEYAGELAYQVPDLAQKELPIASTLYQQYIWENNLSSPDKRVYSEKPKDSKLLIKNNLWYGR